MRQIIPALEKKLSQLKTGDKKQIGIPAADAYGVRNETLIVKVAPDQLPSQNVQVGDQFKGGSNPMNPLFF